MFGMGTFYISIVTGKVWSESKLNQEIEYRALDIYKNVEMRESYSKRYNVDLSDEDNDGDYYNHCYEKAEAAMMRFFKEVVEAR